MYSQVGAASFDNTLMLLKERMESEKLLPKTKGGTGSFDFWERCIVSQLWQELLL